MGNQIEIFLKLDQNSISGLSYAYVYSIDYFFPLPLCDENLIDPCASNSCKNDAKCSRINNDFYVCECASGYTGKHCEVTPC